MRSVLGASFLALTLSLSTPALAHGDLSAADPAAGSEVERGLRAIRLTFAEPPTANSRYEVTDGCGDDVLVQARGEGRNAQLVVAPGQPGRWEVVYRTVSSVDGHVVNGSYRFRVLGERDCSAVPSPAPSPEPEESDAEETGSQEDVDAGTGPLVPIVAAGVVIVGLALLIRKRAT